MTQTIFISSKYTAAAGWITPTLSKTNNSFKLFRSMWYYIGYNLYRREIYEKKNGKLNEKNNFRVPITFMARRVSLLYTYVEHA